LQIRIWEDPFCIFIKEQVFRPSLLITVFGLRINNLPIVLLKDALLDYMMIHMVAGQIITNLEADIGGPIETVTVSTKHGDGIQLTQIGALPHLSVPPKLVSSVKIHIITMLALTGSGFNLKMAAQLD
jgi:hypothetical protein